MSLITVSELSKSYFGRVVLDHVSFRLDRGERLALIGDNGAGKTTLLRLIMGLETPDSGSVILPAQIVTGYLSQNLDLADDHPNSTALTDSGLSRLEARLRCLELEMAADPGQPDLLEQYSILSASFENLGGYDYTRRMQETLAGLGLAGDILHRPLRTLSGGERMRVALARLLLQIPDALLLDEPTNHLDVRAMEWLEEFLRRFKGTVLIVSHDRMFIDRTATAVAELTEGHLDFYPGNYTRFQEVKSAAQANLAKDIRLLSREIERQQEVTQTLLSHRKMTSYHAREKVVGRLADRLAEMSSRSAKSSQHLNFSFLPGLAEGDPKRIVLSTENLGFGYDGRTLFQQVSLIVRNGMKISLCGPNGCGKSTLLDLLMGRLDQFDGQIRMPRQLTFGHMGQQVDFPDEEQTLLTEIMNREDLSEEQARTLLARYGFRSVDVFKKISVLSGGERSRLYLCCLLLERPDMLFLDEPTNHLDISSREILERALVDFPGAMLAASHDRYFIEHCTSQVFGFIGDRILPFSSFDHYRAEARRLEDEPAINERASATAQAAGAEPDSPAKPNRQQNRADERKAGALHREKMRQLEKAISEYEQARQDAEANFATQHEPEFYARYTEILAELERLYAEYIEEDQSGSQPVRE